MVETSSVEGALTSIARSNGWRCAIAGTDAAKNPTATKPTSLLCIATCSFIA
jgi:hypothetical protein